MSKTIQESPTQTLTGGKRIPKHAQLREILLDLCQNELNPGDMLPGERALEETYGVSRITVRRAIGDLVASGHLRRARGKGTFVTHTPMVTHTRLSSFSEEMQRQNIRATSKILASAWDVPDHRVLDFFHAAPHSQHTHLRRLRLGNGEPLCIDDAWYNDRFAPDLLENDVYKSVYAILAQRYLMPITRADQTVTAVAASKIDAEILNIQPKEPLLMVTRLSMSNEHPIELCVSLYRPDRYALHSIVTRQQY
ncbi:GntR family transcriptional regulator [Corynebacterium kutscheri]|uniref:GntR family transcriptional regulator n=1 Tax=Corynebacterium kutscheri TaxID=35755 RepID=UPI000F6EADB5|nr:GntR family transcriptional regulator [Corynebacterium kutscheri]VEH81778.1 GntR family transcriptional regulator [Corynebacterium kutscheri]